MKSRIAVVVALLVCCLPAPAAARQDKVRIFITSRTQSDNPRSNIGTAATALESAVGSALMRKYKCASTLRQSEAYALIDQERKRQLLGGEGGDEALATIGNAVGAEYVASFTLIETGGQLSVNGAMLDNRTVKATVRESTSMTVDEEALEQLESFASTFADRFSGPVCPGDWVGTITVRQDVSDQTKTGGSIVSTYELSIPVRGGGWRATTVSYMAHEKIQTAPSFKGRQYEPMVSDAAGTATVGVDASVYQEKLSISVMKVTMVGKTSGPAVIAGARWTHDVIVENLNIPIPPGAMMLTGRRDDVMHVVEWNFSRAKTASAR